MKTENTTYEQMGIAALLPGMQFAIECMQRQLDEMRAQLAQMQNGDRPGARGRWMPVDPGKPAAKAKGLVNGWPADPAARSAEMMRRQAMARAAKSVDRKRLAHSVAAKKRWAGMTAKQRKQRIANMNAARTVAKSRKAGLAVAS